VGYLVRRVRVEHPVLNKAWAEQGWSSMASNYKDDTDGGAQVLLDLHNPTS